MLVSNGCLRNRVSTWMLLFWCMAPNVCKRSNRTEIQSRYLRSAQPPKPVGHTESFSGCGANPCKPSLSENNLGHPGWGWGGTPPPPHSHTHMIDPAQCSRCGFRAYPQDHNAPYVEQLRKAKNREGLLNACQNDRNLRFVAAGQDHTATCTSCRKGREHGLCCEL